MVPNLYQRLIAVRLALGGSIPKGGTAPQVMGGFKFVEWDDVAERIGTLLAENGIVMLPSMPSCDVAQAGTTASGKPIYRATAPLAYELINADVPEDRTVITWIGSGDDSGDKAIQKAGTSGTKYMLLKLFLLGGAGVADADANGEDSRLDHPAADPPTTKQRPANGSKPKVVAKTPTGHGCPQCGKGNLEHVRWDNGGEKIACTNWRECKYRENVAPVPADEQP
jgi:ssDNA-binding Zn-finger/Zn-ribbon topoisomerase 1